VWTLKHLEEQAKRASTVGVVLLAMSGELLLLVKTKCFVKRVIFSLQ
jgi:hypothetical protein